MPAAVATEQVNGLPKLELKEGKSISSPSEFPTVPHGLTRFLTWNGLGIAFAPNRSLLGVIDQEGIVDKSFLAKGQIYQEIDWNNIVTSRGKKKLGDGSKQALKDTEALQYTDLPRHLHPYAKLIFEGNDNLTCVDTRNSYMPQEAVKVRIDANEATMSSVLKGKYIILEDQEGRNIAFLTQDTLGRPLPPRNWERYDVSVADREYPDDLSLYIEAIKNNPGTYSSINDKFVARITDKGLQILDAANPGTFPLFTDSTLNIGNNFTVDPSNPSVIYFCTTQGPIDIIKLDLSADPKTWHTEAARFPIGYQDITNLKLDPSGNLILFTTQNHLRILDKDTLTEVHTSNIGTYYPYFDSQGDLKRIDESGNIATFTGNLKEVASAIQTRRIEAVTQKVQVRSVFAGEVQARQVRQDIAHLNPQRERITKAFETNILGIRRMDDASRAIEELNRIKTDLGVSGLTVTEVDYITSAISEALDKKIQVVASSEASEIIARVRAKLLKPLSLAIASEVSTDLTDLEKYTVHLSQDTREEIRKAGEDYRAKSAELFRTESANISSQASAILAGVKQRIAAFGSLDQFMDWAESDYPQQIEQLEILAKLCPPEVTEAHQAILQARTNLQLLASEQEKRFKVDNAKVREATAERMESQTQLIRQDIQSLMERLRMKGFKKRGPAETYLEGSKSRRLLEKQIQDLGVLYPEAARELQRNLKVALANALGEIERGSLETAAKSGQRMYRFGQTTFPIWEAKVKEHAKKHLDLVFIPDDKTRGPGIRPDDMLGDVGMVISTSSGKPVKVRLYEGLDTEDNLRFGYASSKGVPMPPSYISGKEFRAIQEHYKDWTSGPESKLRKAFGEMRGRVIKHLEAKPPKKKEAEYAKWRTEYDRLVKEYGDFSTANHIPILRRIDQVWSAPEAEYANGKGYVPEWLPHWTIDKHTERYLEQMAQALNMQLDLQEGILSLKGHAGVGKDVLTKMFCHLTKRPYFGVDCTKWTTEWELSEDIILESKEGASQTVKVPSTVLNAITTRGAVLYFNEISAMTEQAQIFLHALMDEKRTITLKTSSGKVVKADPSVLLISSRNPDYPGNFEPQFATKSRMVEMEIEYPPLLDNGNYDASEALRIARGVDSLTDFTLEPIWDKNEFVRIWDREINGVAYDGGELTKTQEYDLEVVLALVQFGVKLRDNFILNFEKTPEARNALPVTQPLTGREMRRCAYALSKMSPAERGKKTSEATARELLDRYLLSHINSRADRAKIMNAMTQWHAERKAPKRAAKK